MSGWQIVNFDKNPKIITGFKEVFIGEEDVTLKLDRFDITKLSISNYYKIVCFKDGKKVELIPDGAKVKNVMFFKGHIGFSEGETYKIDLENHTTNF